MLKTIILALIVTATLADLAPKDSEKAEYLAWKTKHGVAYDEKEDRYRMFLFKQKSAQISAHNQNKKNTYQKGHNQFSCLTNEEFQKLHLGALPPPDSRLEVANSIPRQVGSDSDDSNSDSQDQNSNSENSEGSESSNDEDTTQSVSVSAQKKTKKGLKSGDHPNVKGPVYHADRQYPDWRATGEVTNVKSQGSCGSCWAFAAIGAIQAARMIHLGDSTSLSEQQMVDCVYQNRTGYQSGCYGGWMDDVYNLIIKNDNGIQTSSNYPYTGSYQNCPNGVGGPIKIRTYAESAKYSCSSLQNLVKQGPVSVTLCASEIQSYSSSVFNGCTSSCSINHAVLLVGYTSSNYWILKNSWGRNWGLEGYFYLNGGDMCRICKYGGQLPLL